MGFDTGIDIDRLWEASDLVDEHIGDEPVAPLAPRLAVRAAEYDLPTGLVAALDTQMRAHGAGDRLNEVLEELQKIRGEAGWPPLAAPIGQILASQALIHVLSARRYGTVVDEFRALVQGRYGTPPAAIDSTVARAVALVTDDVPLEDDPPSAEDVRQEAEGLAASEEELVLIALFGEEAEQLLQNIRGRHTREDAIASGVDQSRAERIREIVQIVQESGIGEVEIEDNGMRVSVRRPEEPVQARARRSPRTSPASCRSRRRRPRPASAWSRRWSASSTARPSRARRRSSSRATSSRRDRRSASSRR